MSTPTPAQAVPAQQGTPPVPQQNKPRTADGRYATPANQGLAAPPKPTGLLNQANQTTPVPTSQQIAAAAAVQHLQATNPELHKKMQEMAEASRAAQSAKAALSGQEKTPVDGGDIPKSSTGDQPAAATGGSPMSNDALDWQKKSIIGDNTIAGLEAKLKAATEKNTKHEEDYNSLFSAVNKAYGTGDVKIIEKKAAEIERQKLAATHEKAKLVAEHVGQWKNAATDAAGKANFENIQTIINQFISGDPVLTNNKENLKAAVQLVDIYHVQATERANRMKNMTDQTAELTALREQFAQQTRTLETERIRGAKLQENLTLTRAGQGNLGGPPRSATATEYNIPVPTGSSNSSFPPSASAIVNAANQRAPQSTLQSRNSAAVPQPPTGHAQAFKQAQMQPASNAFLRGLIGLNASNRTIASFASANAGEPYDASIDSQASASSGPGKRSYLDMNADYERVKSKNPDRYVRPKVHETIIPAFRNNMKCEKTGQRAWLRGYGLGKECIQRMSDPALVDGYNELAKALSIGTALMLESGSRGNMISTIPANSALIQGMDFNPFGDNQ